jgi:hypothetical protein
LTVAGEPLLTTVRAASAAVMADAAADREQSLTRLRPAAAAVTAVAPLLAELDR